MFCAHAVTADGNGIHIKAVNNPFGIMVDGSVTTGSPVDATIVNSSVSANNAMGTGTGIYSYSLTNWTPASVTVRNSSSDGNQYGFRAGGPATIRLANTEASGNYNGVFVDAGGAVYTYGDNDIAGNLVNVSGSPTNAAKK